MIHDPNFLSQVSPKHCNECRTGVFISWNIIDPKKPILVGVNKYQLILV